MSILVTVQNSPAARHRVVYKAETISSAPARMVILALTLLSVTSLGLYGFNYFSSIRNSAATGHAVDLAIANKNVSQILGSPVQVGYFVTGNIYDHLDGTGNANLSIGVKGPGGSGTLYATEHESNGEWYADKLTFRPDGDLVMIAIDESQPPAQSQNQSQSDPQYQP